MDVLDGGLTHDGFASIGLKSGRYSVGLAVFILMMIAAAIAICSETVWGRLTGSGTDGKLVLALLTGWLTILLAGVGGAIKITSTRQSLTSLFRSEIKALQFGLLTIDMFEFWAKLHANPESGALGFADIPRKEDYFATYHTVSNNIGSLHPRVLEAVVRFYMYLKMSRDAAASLNSWENEIGFDGSKDAYRLCCTATLNLDVMGFCGALVYGVYSTISRPRFYAKDTNRI